MNTKQISVTLEILHPISHQILYQKANIIINSMPINCANKEDIAFQSNMVRHLYYQIIEEVIDIPVYIVLFKLVWSKLDNPTIQKVVNGIIDLEEFIKNGSVGKNVQIQLDSPEDIALELQFKLFNQVTFNTNQ